MSIKEFESVGEQNISLVISPRESGIFKPIIISSDGELKLSEKAIFGLFVQGIHQLSTILNSHDGAKTDEGSSRTTEVSLLYRERVYRALVHFASEQDERPHRMLIL